MGNTIFLTWGFQTKPLTDIETYNMTTGEWKTEGNQLYPVEIHDFLENMICVFDTGKIQI